MDGFNPLDWSAGAYLGFHAIALVLAILLGFVIQDGMRPEGRVGVLKGSEDRAMLEGGPVRFMQAVAASLLADGRLAMVDGGMLMRPGMGPRGDTPAEKVLLSNGNRFNLLRQYGALKEPIRMVIRDLRSRGLVMDEGSAMMIRFTQSAPLFMLFLFGAERIRLGWVRREDFGFLVAFEAATLFALVLRFKALNMATKQGRAAIAEDKVRYERLRRAPREPEMAMAVALYGPSALAATALDPFHRFFVSSPSSGGCGSDGGGGCGGGGCGGCGD